MAYVPGWKRISELLKRLDELEREVSGGKVIPAPWEPFYQACPSCRDARAYDWARHRLQSPLYFSVDLAFFPEEGNQPATPIGRANWLFLCAEGEQSRITGKMMLFEALDLWEIHGEKWLEHIVVASAKLGVETTLDCLHKQVHAALRILEQADPATDVWPLSDQGTISRPSHAFDRELLYMDGWTQDPGTIYLPIDGKIHLLAKESLVINLHKLALLRGRRVLRTVDWEKVTLVYLFNGAVTFDVSGETPLAVSGFKHPETVITTIQDCYRAATERMLQALATQVTRTSP